MNPASPPQTARPSAPNSKSSSRRCRRIIGATAAPSKPPIPVSAMITPKCQIGGTPGALTADVSSVPSGFCRMCPVAIPRPVSEDAPRSAKAKRNVTNPTTQRSVPIADAADKTPALRSSAFSCSSSSSAATTVTGTRSEASEAARNTSALRPATAPGPPINNTSAPGMPATNAATPASN